MCCVLRRTYILLRLARVKKEKKKRKGLGKGFFERKKICKEREMTRLENYAQLRISCVCMYLVDAIKKLTGMAEISPLLKHNPDDFKVVRQK